MNTSAPPPKHRAIRSFVLRQGRITQGQAYALDSLWPLFGLETGQAFDSNAIFGRRADLVLEIGFGNGQSLVAMAASAPETDFLGIEVHRPGIGHLLLEAQALELRNLRVYCADAIEILKTRIATNSLHRIQIFFPDPWPKQRHHKRRLVNTEFLGLACSRLKPGGVLHCATDWENYAKQMLRLMESCPELSNLAGQGLFSPRPEYRPLTKFEQRGQGLGHGVWDLLFEKTT